MNSVETFSKDELLKIETRSVGREAAWRSVTHRAPLLHYGRRSNPYSPTRRFARTLTRFHAVATIVSG